MLTALTRRCTCTLLRTTTTAIPHTIARFSTSSSSSSETPLPWFVDPETAPTRNTTTPSTSTSHPLATAPIPTTPPSHLSSSLHPLHKYLSTSPLFNKDNLTYINAREIDPSESWTDWIVICTLKEGRERGVRGAVESIRTYLSKNPIEFNDDHETEELAENIHLPPSFSPPLTTPQIHGLPPLTTSKHSRSRLHRTQSKGASLMKREEQTSGWALLDGGTLVVHVMTIEAREEFGNEIERVWNGLRKSSNQLEGRGGEKEEMMKEEREKELRDNLERVRKEMEDRGESVR